MEKETVMERKWYDSRVSKRKGRQKSDTDEE